MAYIFTEGATDSEIAIVGDYPGESEMQRLQPFAGKIGSQLNSSLRAAGINRRHCYLDLVIQDVLRPEEVYPIIHANSKGEIQVTPAFDEARDALIARLQATKAKVIVACGDIALYALMDKWSITKHRGSIYDNPELPGKQIIPIIHPRELIKVLLFHYYTVSDLHRVVARVKIDAPYSYPRNMTLDPRMADVENFIANVKGLGHVAFDVETDIKTKAITHFSLATAPKEAICVPLYEHGKDIWHPEQEAYIWQMVGGVLQDPDIVVYGQNITFDASCVYHHYGIVISNMHDTMVMMAKLYPEFPKGLDFLQSLFCDGEPYYKDDGKEWRNNIYGSITEFRRYSAMDSAIVMQIFPKIRQELYDRNNWQAYEDQVALIPSLLFMGERGIAIQKDALKQMATDCEAEEEAAQAELTKLCGFELNPKSPKQVAEYFYIQKGYRTRKKRTKDGSRVTTDHRALESLALEGAEEAQLLIKLRELGKMRGTYYEMELDDDNRIRCFYNPVGTKQTRVSSSKHIVGTGANLQNQPHNMLDLMYPDPGYIALSFDLAQAENRVVAYIAPEHTMIRAFEEGIDIHSQTAASLYGVRIDEVTPDQRFWGKKANHGLDYGLGINGFALNLNISTKFATFIYNGFHNTYPGVQQYHSWVREALSRGRELINPFDDHHPFLDWLNDNLYRRAYNQIPQSTIAHITNNFGYAYIYDRQDLFPEVDVVVTVHDSVKVQVPLSTTRERILEIIQLIRDSMNVELHWKDKEFTIPVDVAMGFTFGDAKVWEWKAAYIDDTPDEQLITEFNANVALNQ
jgi:uracil-DNA glycosylase family 4